MRFACLLPLLLALRPAAASSELVRHPVPELPCCSWNKVNHFVSDEDPITVRFSVKQRNLDPLRKIAAEVSDPRSAKYGEYLSTAAVRELTQPDPADIKIVAEWLAQAGVPFDLPTGGGGEIVEARFTVATATRLLNTRFQYATSTATKQRALRAGDYWLPADLHAAVAAVYGLHGLPSPPREALRSATATPAVTPKVLSSTYKISGVKVSGAVTNPQAVAEFQGQTSNATDLTEFFKLFAAGDPSADSTVSKFVGDNGTGVAGVEAELDIQYIMGVAPGIKSQFWYWAGMDFCGDLKSWTDAILDDSNPPLVNSVSYGIQASLAAIGCQQSSAEDVDANFVKLAAKGITIIFASGDSGSGYAPSCGLPNSTLPNTSVKGTKGQTFAVMSAGECCEEASSDPRSVAWTFTPPPAVKEPQCSPKSGEAFVGHVHYRVPVDAPGRPDPAQVCCDTAMDPSFQDVKGYTYVSPWCSLFSNISGTKAQPSAQSSHVTQPVQGVCTAFTSVTGTATTPGDTSGGDAVKPVAPVLYPSWPASSPWVTAVGATRFINQMVGQPEMASDQFGSGGGFSTMFAAFKDQADVVSNYLKIATDLPPKGSFPPGGRATPDISALGEGYQVVVNGHVHSIGGTSASTPAFAGMVSLLNEARLAAGKKPMGYLNPFIYQNPNAFTDVTVGTNAIGRGNGPIKYGFKCAKGWDPATGLGTPIFDKLLSAAMTAGPSTIVV